MVEGPNWKMISYLAHTYMGWTLPLTVCKSDRGYYLGVSTMYGCGSQGPISRDSEYWATEEEAKAALKSGEWDQRPNP